MRRTFKIAYLAVALAGVTLGAVMPAQAADVTVGIGEGGIAFGYNDGYWDRDHRWHKWRDEHEAADWRREHREHYYDWRHDRDHDRDQGWREHERYWEHN